jgi:hypothetical protein
MLAGILIVRLEASARLQEQVALLSKSALVPFSPSNQFVFKDKHRLSCPPPWEVENERVS